jgi:pimeloyl-ACP methyl ester carboxylesterase
MSVHRINGVNPEEPRVRSRRLAAARFPCVAAVLSVVALAGCVATTPPITQVYPKDPPTGPALLRSLPVDRALEDRILALDPQRVTPRDVRETLAQGPTPRIVLLHGGVYPVHLSMNSLALFLIGMGYPEAKIRDAGDGEFSHGPYGSSERIAGAIAWYYEHEGTRPMLIGHSQGGMQAVRVLHDLAGSFEKSLPVWNPLTDSAEPRTTIVDPFTGQPRGVVGTRLSFASAVGAGGPSSILPNQWGIVPKLRDIPDSVDEFTGYFIGFDLFAMNFSAAGIPEFRSEGKAVVRNVLLPADYLHVSAPVTHFLLQTPGMREFIDAYVPGTTSREASPEKTADNLMYAADLWYMIRKHWTLEAQRVVRARRTATTAAE